MRLLEHFFELIAPNDCLTCGSEGSLICWWCREDALPAQPSRCYKCNKLTKFGAVCSNCRRKSPLKHIFIRADYSGAAKELVHKMKFSYSGEAAELIATELLNTIPALPSGTVIVHVPTITSHVRSRGFDHASRMAKALSGQLGLRHVPALTRIGQHRQVGSKRSERLSLVQNSFRSRSEYLIKDASVLLVDDVLTTGATIESAAKVLRAAGAKSVDAVIFARAK